MATTSPSTSPTPVRGELRPDGSFARQPNAFRGRISADGSSGFKAEPGRYHLYVSLACPWAHRQMIVRRLLGLEHVISLSVVDPIRDERGWAFSSPGFEDPVNGFAFLSEAYLATDPGFEGRWTVPVLWDRETGTIATNDYPEISLQLETEFTEWARPGVDLYPEHLRPEIDALNQVLFDDVNNGVYKAGFATSQQAYEVSVDALFARLDDLERRLEDHRYLVGDQLTESDVRLWVTVVRFDAVYHGHFKCNLRRIVDYPSLWAWSRDLWQRPGFGDTVDFDHIKRHYYQTHPNLNPSRLVPKGPLLDWEEPHGRERLRA